MSDDYVPPPHTMKPVSVQVKAPAFKFVKDMTDDQLRKLAREKLSEALQAIDPVSQPALTQKLCAEVKDRLDGKPMQMIQDSRLSNAQPTTINITYVSAPLRNQTEKDSEIKTIDH